MSAADRRPALERINPHCYALGVYRLTHHRIAPASWVVTRDGHHISEHVTLRDAADSLRGAA